MSAFSPRLAAQPIGATTARPGGTLPILALVAMLVFAMIAITAAAPAPTSALSVLTTRCDGVGVRTKASTTSTKVATLPKGTKVVAVAKVSGGSWKTVCAGVTKTGSSWYRLTVVNGKDVLSRYGVTYVYTASSLLKWLSSFWYREPACSGVSIRTSASTSATKKASLALDTKVTVTGTVSGGSWSATCAGKTVSGKTWYVIKAINGTSVSTLYGVSTVYGAYGLFKPWSTESTASTSSPTPTATASPTPSPTASASATPTPTPTSTYWEGIDVSHWQGAIDWAKVKNAGKRFAYHQGDRGHRLHRQHVRHQPRPGEGPGHQGRRVPLRPAEHHAGDAVAEANWFVKIAAPVSGELIPVLDLEVTGGLSATQLQSWTKAFMDRVYTLTGVRGAIYVSPSFWSNNVGNTTCSPRPATRSLWVAHWTTASQPTVPANNWGSNGWTFWQYTSQRHGERHRRAGGPGPLPVHELDQGPHPVGRGRPEPARPSPMLLGTWIRAARQPRARRTTAGTA